MAKVGQPEYEQVSFLNHMYLVLLKSLSWSIALNAATAMFSIDSHHNIASYDAHVQTTCKAESTRRHVVEDYERNLKLVQVLECKLEVNWASKAQGS